MPTVLFTKHILRKLFLEDWAMKLVALAITLGLWLGVTGLGTRKKERFNSVPLTFRVSSDAEITNAPVQDVSLVLSGDSRRLDEVRQADLNVSVDLTGVTPADLIVTLEPQSVNVSGLPRGITLDEIQPLRIPVRLEAVEEKDVDVEPVTEGAPAAGYEVYSTMVLPPRIRVHGPKDFVDTLESIPTDKISLAGKKDDFVAKQIAVLVSNPKATVLATVVDVQFRIGEKRVERVFTAPIAGLPGKTATFTIYGPRTALQKLKPDAFKVEMLLNENGEEVPEIALPVEMQDVAEVRKISQNRER
jgi:YbbR domain-containing protein